MDKHKVLDGNDNFKGKEENNDVKETHDNLKEKTKDRDVSQARKEENEKFNKFDKSNPEEETGVQAAEGKEQHKPDEHSREKETSKFESKVESGKPVMLKDKEDGVYHVQAKEWKENEVDSKDHAGMKAHENAGLITHFFISNSTFNLGLGVA